MSSDNGLPPAPVNTTISRASRFWMCHQSTLDQFLTMVDTAGRLAIDAALMAATKRAIALAGKRLPADRRFGDLLEIRGNLQMDADALAQLRKLDRYAYVFVDTPGFQTLHGNALNKSLNALNPLPLSGSEQQNPTAPLLILFSEQV